MSLPLLALFTRSLREDARGKAAYWARAGLCGFILFVLFAIAVSNLWTGAPGKTFFISIISLQAMAVTFVGLSYFASAIAEEKEEQTLGLLRMTDLNPLSILLGKSTSRLCSALLLLAAQFPFTVFAVTLGGISLGQIAAAYCTLAAYTFLLCNVALLGSVLARRTAGAAVFSVLVITLLLSAGPLVGSLHGKLRSLGVSSRLDRVADIFWNTTPIARLVEVLGTGFSGSPVGWQVASNLGLGVGCFLLAWAAFGRFCERAPDDASTGRGPLRIPGLSHRRAPRPWKNALAWKDYYFLCGGRVGMMARVVAYGGALVGALCEVLFVARPTTPGAFTSTFQSLIPFVFSIDVAAMAARIFRTELNEQTLTALAGLPCTMRQIAYRKAGACLLAAVPGAFCTVAGGILFVFTFSDGNNMFSMKGMMAGHLVAGWVNTIFLVHVVAWLSLALKRGALPLGYVLTQAFSMLITIAAVALIGLNAAFATGNISILAYSPIIGSVGSLLISIFLHRQSLRRLEALAGES